MFNKKPINIAVTIAKDSTTAEILPQVVEAGLQNPASLDEMGLIFGWVEKRKFIHDIQNVAGVIAVEQQRNMGSASNEASTS